MIEIKLPELGEGIEKATIAFWHCAEGDMIHRDDDIAEVVTDKATFNIPSEVKGVVVKICAKIGEDVAIGSTIAVLDDKG